MLFRSENFGKETFRDGAAFLLIKVLSSFLFFIFWNLIAEIFVYQKGKRKKEKGDELKLDYFSGLFFIFILLP